MIVLDQNKQLEQEAHIRSWNKHGRKGTCVAVTGVGKTKIGLMAMEQIFSENPNAKVLIIVPTENLKKNEWPNEMVFWDMDRFANRVDIQCIQTVYKYTGQQYDLVIVDEVHTTLGVEYASFYENNVYKAILCLTATVPDESTSKTLLQSIAPIVHITDIVRAKKLNLISDYVVFNLPVEFTLEESIKYAEVDATFTKLTNRLGGPGIAFVNANLYKTSSDKDKRQLSALYYIFMQKRKWLCYGAHNKLDVTKGIIQKFPSRKALIFSETKKFATAISKHIGSCDLFHSGLSSSTRQRVLDKFANGSITAISSVKALDAGLNVPDCSLGICTSGTSKDLQDTQRKGRTIRKVDGKVSIYVNLFVKDSQEVKWVRKRLKGERNVKWINSIDEIKI